MNDTIDDSAQATSDSTERHTRNDSDITESLREPLAGQSEDGLPLETIFDILRNERRQQVLGYIAVTDDDVIQIGELAEQVAAIENGVTVNALSSQQRKRVYVALYQCHLPKMADTDVIEFVKDRGTIRRGENADQITPYLDVPTDDGAEAAPVRRSLAVFAASCLLAYLLAASSGPNGTALGGVTVLAGFFVGLGLEYRDRNE
jgi:hypothetical protein